MRDECALAIIWLDWGPYHLARLRALMRHPSLRGRVRGIEMVGGEGIHSGISFRARHHDGLPLTTVLPGADWEKESQLRMAGAMWRELGKLDPKVVLIPGYNTLPAIVAALWAQMHRRRSVLMLDSTANDRTRGRCKEFVKAALCSILFHGAITAGKRSSAYVSSLGFRQTNIAGFYDVVENDYFARGTRSLRRLTPLQYGMPKNYFLFVGRLSEEKNLRYLLEEYRSYRLGGGNWALVITGAGPMETELQTIVRQLQIPEVLFAGFRTGTALLVCYAFAQCLILPSKNETWGLTVNEAMASGLPVLVSTHCGCVDDLVEEGGNGYTFDPLTEGTLSHAMNRIWAMADKSRIAIGQRSSEIIRKYSLEHWAAEVLRITGL